MAYRNGEILKVMLITIEADITKMAPVSRGQGLGTEYQIHGGSKRVTMEQTLKRANGDVDFIPEHGFEGEEFIPGIPNVIVAEEVWPKITRGNHISEVENMLKMRLLSKFWCAFIDCTELMDRQQMLKYNKVGPWRFKEAPGRFQVFARLVSR